MTSDPKRVQAVFLLAAESPLDDRAAVLDRECGGDSTLRHAVDSLLAAHDQPGSFLDRPLGQLDPGPPPPAPSDFAAGTLIGPYTLVQKLGEGGMGTVWAAEQEQPVRRRVAVKLIKPGMDSAHVLRRFEQEREALALMDHPNIARILDAGVEAARGCPYFVLELVKGVPITTYCDELHLSVRERLELFVPVCRAVQHAHQKGIVHRDLKPGNVLVCVPDGRPVPKVIDFGVAKALHRPLTAGSLYTAVGAVVGTLQYMSPEQAELSPLDVDTRSDVYGLGVLLYELLTGTTPLDPKRLQAAAFAETLRVIREEEPPRPSTRLSDSKESLPNLAAMRRTEPARLTKEVSGDLDWIVMRCLEKDRTRRYETANGLARDLERFLTDEPVEARPPTAGYQVRKFVRRNRRGVIAAGVVLAALVLGVIGTTAGMVWALREKDAKEQARRDAVTSAERATEAAARAERRLGQLDKANDILASVFHRLNPNVRDEENRSLREALGERLDKAAAQLDAEAVGDPPAVARLQHRLGNSYLELGYPEKAIGLLAKARRTYQAELGADDRATLNAAGALARAYKHAGRTDDALPLFEETLARQTERFGLTDRDTLNSMNNLATAYMDTPRRAEGLALCKRALALMKEHLGPTDPGTLNCMSNLAWAIRDGGNAEEAIPLQVEVLRHTTQALTATHPDTLVAMSNLGLSYCDAGRPQNALPIYEEALKHSRLVPGPTHPDTLLLMNNLAACLEQLGRRGEAVPIYVEVLKLVTEKRGRVHPQTLISISNLAEAYRAEGRLDDALPLHEEALAIARKVHTGPHPHTLILMNNLALAYKGKRRLAEAAALYEEALRLQRETRGPDHRETANTAGGLAATYLAARRPAPALPLLAEFLAVQRKLLKDETTKLAGILSQISADLLDCNEFVEAEKLLRECQTIRDAKQPDEWTTFHSKSLLGRSLLAQQKFADAEPLLVQGYEGIRQRKDKVPPQFKMRLPEAADALIRLYTEWGKPDKVAECRKERAQYPPEVLPPPRKLDP